MRDEELEEIPSLEGEEVGHWRLEEKLGEGGMSVVYHGRHKTQQLEGAVKLLHPELCRNRKVVQRFQQEAEAASQLDHENVITSQDQMVEVCFGAKSRISTHIESFTPSPTKSPQK